MLPKRSEKTSKEEKKMKFKNNSQRKAVMSKLNSRKWNTFRFTREITNQPYGIIISKQASAMSKAGIPAKDIVNKIKQQYADVLHNTKITSKDWDKIESQIRFNQKARVIEKRIRQL